MKRILWALPICLAASQPVQADDTTSGLLGFLAGGAGSGKTELGDHAGEIEAWAIATQTAMTASKGVWKEIAKENPSANVLIVDSSAKFSLMPYWLVSNRTKTMSEELAKAEAKACSPIKILSTEEADVKSDSPLPTLAGLVLSDKKIDDITIEPSKPFWLNALASKSNRSAAGFNGKAYLLSSLNPNPFAEVSSNWTKFVDRAKQEIAACTAGAKENDKRKAALGAVGDLISETDKAFKEADKDSQSILEQASQLEPLLKDGPLLILRTDLEKVGATVVTTKNLLTMFGLPAVTLSGGLIGTFAVEQTNAGGIGPNTLVASGNIACTGPRRPLGQWHGGNLQGGECFINGEPYPAPPTKPANK